MDSPKADTRRSAIEIRADGRNGYPIWRGAVEDRAERPSGRFTARSAAAPGPPERRSARSQELMEPTEHWQEIPDYLSFLRSRALSIITGLVVGVAAAIALLVVTPAQYTSHAAVSVHPLPDDSSTAVANGRTSGLLNLDTEAQIVKSTQVATGAQKILQVSTPVTTMINHVVVTVPANSGILTISYEAHSAKAAAAGAQAFAQAYLANRLSSAQSDLNAQIATYRKQMATAQTALQKVTEKLQTEVSSTSSAANDRQTQALLATQVKTYSQSLSELTTTTVIPGSIISAAQPPSVPSGPNKIVYLVSGVMLGLLGGLLLGLWRSRRDKRIRNISAIADSGLPILASLPGGLPHDAVLSSDARAVPSVLQLCNVISASISENTRRFAVVGIDIDPSAVVTNLGIGLSQMGWTVAVVGVGPDWQSATTQLISTQRGPGLADILQGRKPVRSGLYESGRHPGLSLLATRPDSDLALEQAGPAAVGRLLDELRGFADVVVVSIAATEDNGGVAAQMLASVSDVTIAVAAVGTSRRDGLFDLVSQAGRVGAGLRGVVAVARATRRQSRDLASMNTQGSAATPVATSKLAASQAAGKGDAGFAAPDASGASRRRHER
jgi:capsular polysaccharide biosynthesis protein